MAERICPHCKQVWPRKRQPLLCAQCGEPVGRRGWRHGLDGRPQHLRCMEKTQPKQNGVKLKESDGGGAAPLFAATEDEPKGEEDDGEFGATNE